MMDCQWRFVALQVLFLYTAYVYTKIDNVNINDLKSQLPEGILPPGFGNVTITQEDVENVLRDKCLKASGNSSAYEEVKNGAMILSECLTSLVNMTSVQEEIELATPKGDLDIVFNKYCNKRPDAIKCIHEFKKVVDPCLEPEEGKHSEVFVRIITSLLNFVCHKGGDQIALFIAEGGPECFDQSKKTLEDCMNKTFSNYMQNSPGIPSLENLPQFIMGPKQCQEMDELQTCVVDALEKCEDITPANIVDSMFRFIRNETSCPEKSFSSRQAPHLTSLLSIFIMALLAKALIF